jgi:hypothetical protein
MSNVAEIDTHLRQAAMELSIKVNQNSIDIDIIIADAEIIFNFLKGKSK